MSNYTLQRLQFGSQDRVPDHEADLILSNIPVPLEKKLVNSKTDQLWDLVFSYESGSFYFANQAVPAIDQAVIQSWYNPEGSPCPGCNNALVLYPFIIDDTGTSSGFAQATHFVDFSQATPSDNTINTDTLVGASVTATVHHELPQYAAITIDSQSTSHSVIITITKTQAVFDKIFVLFGNNSLTGNTLTVQKKQSCQALAIFKKTSSTSSREIPTPQFPKIPKTEWPQIISTIVRETVLNEKGQIYEYLSLRTIAALDRETIKSAIDAISQRIESLNKIKNGIAKLGE